MSVSSGRRITHILGAELDKLKTLPWIWLTLVVTFTLNLGLAGVYTALRLRGTAGTQGILDSGLASIGYIQAGFIILGILAACSEYNGGQIRTTLTAMPWRGWQLFAKYLALAMITLPAALIIAASGVLYTYMMKDITDVIKIDTTLQALAGSTGYLTLTTLLSAAIGSLLRRSTPALVIMLGYYFVISPLTEEVLPDYLPDTAGYYMYMPSSSSEINVLTPLQGTGIVMLWTLILMAAAMVCYRRRDA